MVVATIIILGILLVLFGDLPSVFKGTYTIHIALPSSPGVQPETPVRVNGVLIGRVKTVGLDAEGKPAVTAKIEQKYQLYQDQLARVAGSFLGDAVIEIVPGDGTEPHIAIQDGGVIRGIVAKDPLQAIASLEGNISTAADAIAKTADEIGRLANRANRIFDQNEAQINRILVNTDSAVTQLRSMVANVDEIVSDPQVRENLKRAVNDLPKVLNDLSETVSGVRTVMQRADTNLANLEGFTKPLGDRGPTLVAGLDRAVGQLDVLMKDLGGFTQALTNSQGTLARLVNDPKLYDDVSQTVSNLNQLTRELKPILNDVRAFSDKAARHPEQFGLRGLIEQNSGIK
jgi:phospholipid/cholesterol/gamma-HCH transport system substrate-binding protein